MDLKDSKLENNLGVDRSIRTNVPASTNKKPKKKIFKYILITLLVAIIGGLGFLTYKGYIFSKEIGFKFNPNSLIQTKKNELKKDSSGENTNILLVGLDTRESGSLMNTDTIILASYNYEMNNISMISIPRDFHVETEEDSDWFARINSIYSSAEQQEEGSGITALTETVERVTGQEIQYYATVDFKAFVEIVDAVGGVDINVENSFTDYSYPLGDKYTTVSFKAGPQTMDGETALAYSRSRHSQQNNEGTDFARARRQQKVIIALKEKILSSESLSNPKTLMGIISSIAGNLKFSEFTLNDVDAAFELAKKFDEGNGKTLSFVLDPTVGGYSLVEKKDMPSGAYAIGPKLGLGKYDDIIEYITELKKNPELYSEDAKIMVYDTGLGFKASQELVDEIKEENPYLNIVFAGTKFKDKEGTIVYSREDGFSKTVETLSKYLNTEENERPEYITTNLNGEDVTILLGKTIELTEE